MQRASQRKTILIADASSYSRQLVLKLERPGALQADLAVLSSPAEARAQLGAPDREFQALFVSVSLPEQGAITVVKDAHELRPSIPIFFMNDAQSILSHELLKKLGVHGVLDENAFHSTLSALMGQQPLRLGRKDRAETALPSAEGEAELLSDSDFIALKAEGFPYGLPSFFDLFVRLPAGQYLRILKAGDELSEDRLAAFLEKGITRLFVKKAAQSDYIEFCGEVSRALNVSSALSRKKIQRSLSYGAVVTDYLKEQGVDSRAIGQATRFVEDVARVVREIGVDKAPEIRDYLADLASYDHAVSATFIASLMLRPLCFAASRPIHIVGLATFFHDIGLRILLPSMDDEAQELNPAERVLFLKHPAVGAEILSKLPGIDPITVQAVAQHHERRSRTEFHAVSAYKSITYVAEIVGIADEFASVIRRAAKRPGIDPLGEMERMFPSFSRSITDAFRQTFFGARRRRRFA